MSGSADEGAARAAHDKCEGWAAGVVLAARAFRDGADVHLLTGRHRLVADFVLEEVLAQLDSATTTFLMESAVLDTFCAAQLMWCCNATILRGCWRRSSNRATCS